MSSNNQTALMALILTLGMAYIGSNSHNPWTQAMFWVLTIICFLVFMGTIEIKRRK